MSGAHAQLSPSGHRGWSNCAGWKSSSESSEFAREGTAAHTLASNCLNAQADAIEYLGDAIDADGQDFLVDEDMAENVQIYLDFVRALPGEIYVEVSLPISQITGEQDARGTADCISVDNTEITVVDLKYGRGLRVEAHGNGQLMMYAAGAVNEFDMFGPFETIRMIIHQPRLGAVSEYTITSDELAAFVVKTREAAALHGAPGAELSPSEGTCRWCVKSGVCESQTNLVLTTIADSFVDVKRAVDVQVGGAAARIETCDLIELSNCAQATGLITAWVKAVETRVARELFNGNPVRGFKIVEGKLGNRAWVDEARVKRALSKAGIKPAQYYKKVLISPTQAEKLLKGNDAWAPLNAQITRAPGAQTVAPESDKRPALSMDSTTLFETLGD